jgi:hypothetical protein
VLTKVDKGGLKAGRRAQAKVLAAVEEVGCPPPCAIAVTSASKSVGRADMWRMLRSLVID